MLITTLHETTFEYERPVHASFTEARLRPLSDTHQECREFSLVGRSQRADTPGRDYFDNWLHTWNILAPPPHPRRLGALGGGARGASRFKVQALCRVGSEARAGRLPRLRRPVERHSRSAPDGARGGLLSRPMTQEQVLGTMRQSQTIFTDHVRAGAGLEPADLRGVLFAPMTTSVDTSHLALSSPQGGGVCRICAHVSRRGAAAGLPARYVSGIW
jgi:hypothetical protein